MYSLQTLWYMSVLIPPGAMQLTVIFLSPMSISVSWVPTKLQGELTDCHAADESLDSTLATRVQSMFRNTLRLSSDTSHHDKTATNRQMSVRLSSNEELSSSVDVHNTVVLLLSHISNVAERNNTRVRADDIQFTEVSNGLSEERDDVLYNRNIGLDGDGVAAGSLDLGYDFISCLGGVGVVDDDFGSSSPELESHFSADSSSCLG